MAVNVGGERALSFPFRFSSRLVANEVASPEKIWDQRVRAALLTRKGERFSRMAYGSRLAEMVFDGGQVNETAIKDEVGRTFAGLLPALTLDSVEVVWDELAKQTIVAVSYQLPNQDTVTTSIGSLLVDGISPPNEGPA